MRVLVVNAGSSSLKVSVLDGEQTVADRTVERWEGGDTSPIAELLELAGPVDAVGHRVVHGGPRHRGAAVLDDRLLAELTALTDLAPLHQPRALAGTTAVQALLPDVPAVACFDTSFHRTLPPAARTYALPARWNARWDLQRYGFHGLSHQYAAGRAAELLGADADHDLRIVTCHLGAGASLCAVRAGRSVDTTMGFTPLAGLVMQTRAGDVDPGLLLWVLDHGLSLAELSHDLHHDAGLAGLSGTSGDLRDVLAGRAAGQAAPTLAYDVLVHRIVTQVGAMAVSCGGLDALVLTGGMGEGSPELRHDVADRLRLLGVDLDDDANEKADGDGDLSAEGAGVRTLVLVAREDLQVARETAALLR